MAEIIGNIDNKAALARRKKFSTRVDLTPMVDLGFLLITFFIFTTTMGESKTMKLIMPDDSVVDEPATYGESKTLNVLLVSTDSVQYYFGKDAVTATTIPFHQLRNVIISRKQFLSKQFPDDNSLLVLLKPTAATTYQSLINSLDEMLINDIKRYMIVDVEDGQQPGYNK